VMASALLPDAGAHAPALRRIDTLLVVGLAWVAAVGALRAAARSGPRHGPARSAPGRCQACALPAAAVCGSRGGRGQVPAKVWAANSQLTRFSSQVSTYAGRAFW